MASDQDHQQTPEFLLRIIDGIPEPVMVVNRDYSLAFANRAARRLGEGVAPVGRELRCHQFHERDEPCSWPDHVCPLNDVFTRKAQRTALHSHTVAGGREMMVEISAAPILDDDGEVVQLIEVWHDVSERKRAEKALQDERDFIHEVLQTAAVLVVVLDTEGRIVRFNRACERTTGYRGHEVMGTRVWDRLLIPEDVESVKRVFAQLRSGHFPNEHENYWVARDGTRRMIAWSNTAVLGAEGEIRYVIGTGIDVTARRQAEEERRQIEAKMQQTQKLESLGVLAGGIAHDFNNLLMGVLGNADLALLDLAPTSPGRDYVKGIEDAALRATELCEQMLAYSGHGRFVVESIDLSLLVEEMVHLLELSIAKSAVLRLNLAPNLPLVQAEATQIRQVVMNLITNASDALDGRSGMIVVTTGARECDREYLGKTFAAEELAPGCYVYVEVADGGRGMDKETRGRMFDPFFTTKATGRGLGMAAVQGIMRGHKGAIKVESESGQGTRIKFFLPASDVAPAATEAEEEEAAAAEDWSATGTVLLVDDEETVRAVTALMLRRLGFEVLTAVDGRGALAHLGQHGDEIVLVLLDMTMPFMDGREAYGELRRLRGDLPVIVSSGYNAEEAADRFAGKGLAGFIQKPFRLETLREKIRQALAPPHPPGDALTVTSIPLQGERDPSSGEVISGGEVDDRDDMDGG